MTTQSYKAGELAQLFSQKPGASSSSGLEEVARVFSQPIIPPPVQAKDSKPKDTKKRPRPLEPEERIEAEDDDQSLRGSTSASKKARSNEEGRGDADRNARTLFVGNVPASKKAKAKLKRFFTQRVGPVESVRLRAVPIGGAAIPANSGYKLMRKVSVNKGSFSKAVEAPTCVAYVVFQAQSESQSQEEYVDLVAKAKSMADEEAFVFEGNPLRLDRAESSKKERLFERKRTVFVGNLPFIATENMVMEYFSKKLSCRVTSVRLIRDKASNMGKGIGYVLLPDQTLLEPALALNGKTFEGREIRVSRCERAKAEKNGKLRKFQGKHSQRGATKLGRMKKMGKSAGKTMSKRKQREKKVKKLEKKVRKKAKKEERSKG